MTTFDLDTFLETDGTALRAQIADAVQWRGGEAEDLAQDVIVRLLRYRHRLRDADHTRFLAFRIALGMVANAMQRRRSAVPLSPEFDRPSDDDVSRWLENDEFLAVARSVLTSQQFAVWLAVAVHGMAHEEVAAQIGVSNDAVRAALYRAWKALRDQAHRFQAIVAGFALPTRRWLPWARPEGVAFGAVVGAVAGLGLLAVPSHPPQRRPAPAVVSPRVADGDASASEPSAFLAAAPGQPRDAMAAVELRRSTSTLAHGADSAARPSPKMSGCVGGLCHGARDDQQPRQGHGIWVNAPSYPGEWWQQNVPACDVVDLLPRNDLVGCTRYGPANEPLVEPLVST